MAKNIKVRYYSDNVGETRTLIFAANGEELFASTEGYKRAVDARNAIAVLRDAFQMGNVDYETTPDVTESGPEGPEVEDEAVVEDEAESETTNVDSPGFQEG